MNTHLTAGSLLATNGPELSRRMPGAIRKPWWFGSRLIAAAIILCVAGATRVTAQPTTVRASVSSLGIQGNGAVESVTALSADGRFVVFSSDATNLVAGDTNGATDVFVRDLVAGTTERVSVATGGAQGNDGSRVGWMSPDGRFVVFTSLATNLVAGDTNGAQDVFLRDRQAGTTERISIATSGTQGNGNSGAGTPGNHISADGRFVLFESFASNLVAGDTNGFEDIFVRDRMAGTTVRANLAYNGAQSNSGSGSAAISADGRFVSFASSATNLVADPDVNSANDIFVRDLVAGNTERVSESSSGQQANAGSTSSSISGDGRYVAFFGSATNLVAGDTNGHTDVFVHDRLTGVTERVSVSSDGTQQNGDINNTYSNSRGAVQISSDGRFVVFGSFASNLVPSDTNGAGDVFVHDRQSGATERVSLASNGAAGNGASGATVAISADGLFVALASDATNLVAGDTNGLTDAFVRGPREFQETPPDVVPPTFGAGGVAPGRGIHGNGTTVVRGPGVNTLTGSVYKTVIDIALPGPDFAPFSFVRTYNSMDPIGTLGQGWTSSYQDMLLLRSDGSVVFRSDDGNQLTFTPQGGGGFSAPAGAFSTLEATIGGYTLTRSDQVTYTFDEAGRLLAKADLSGNMIVLTRAVDGNLTSITDPAGRTMAVDTDQEGRITAITLPDGRFVQYDYASALLVAVHDLAGQITTYTYDAAGRLATIIDPNGDTQLTTLYDANGHATDQFDATGQHTSFSVDAGTGISTLTDAQGQVVQDIYANGMLQSTVMPQGATADRTYDAARNIVSETDERGNTTTMTYDGQGNLLTRTGPTPLSYIDSYTYDSQNDLLTHTDGRGATTTNTYDTQGNLLTTTDPLGHTTAHTYNSAGQVTSVTDQNGHTTTYGYDAAGNRVSETSPLGHTKTWTYDSAGQCTSEVEARGNEPGANPDTYRTRFTYDAMGHLATTTDPLGHTTRYGYDQAGQLITVTDPTGAVTTNTYDAARRLLSKMAADGGATTYAYDTLGHLVSETDPLGNSTTYAYDARGQQVAKVTARGNIPGGTPSAFRWTYEYDPNGNQLTTTDPLGHTTRNTYDVLNRLSAKADPAGRTTTYGYDAVGNRTTVIDAAGGTTTSAYDLRNRLISVTDPLGHTTTYTYDNADNRTAVRTPMGEVTTYAYDSDNRWISMVDPRGNQSGATPRDFETTYSYDAGGHETGVTDPLGNTTTSTFDPAGRHISRTDPNGHTITYVYDAAGRLTGVQGPDGGLTSYIRDIVGNVVHRTDPNMHVTTYTYDLDERLTDTASPLGQHWTNSYDVEGHVISVEDPRGHAAMNPSTGTTNYTYDAAGRRVSIDYGDGTPDVTYTLDPSGAILAMADGQGTSGTETYTLDGLARRTAVTRDGSTITYGYDAASRVISRTYPTGTRGKPFEATTTYDPDGRVSAIFMNGNPVASYTYDPAGNLLGQTFGNGVVETRTYDPAARILDVTHSKGGTVLTRFNYTYDRVGNPLTVLSQSGNETYSYDSADRVIKVCYTTACMEPGSFIEYTYDGVGNRVTETRSIGTTTYAYDAGDELLQTTTPANVTTAYSYDPAGNEIAAGTTHFAYDLANRMISASPPGKTWGYKYDGNGHRLSVSRVPFPIPMTRFLWDTSGPLPLLALEFKGTGAESHRYLYGDGPLATGNGTTLKTYYHLDRLRSMRAASTKTGHISGTEAYEPFGADRAKPKGALSKNPVRFAGEYLDTSTGLYHLRARQYDPTTGRFLGRDPVMTTPDEAAQSAYSYANDRPTVMVDPRGEWAGPPYATKHTTCPFGSICLYENAYGAGGDTVVFPGSWAHSVCSVSTAGQPRNSSNYTREPRFPDGRSLNDHVSAIVNASSYYVHFFVNANFGNDWDPGHDDNPASDGAYYSGYVFPPLTWDLDLSRYPRWRYQREGGCNKISLSKAFVSQIIGLNPWCGANFNDRFSSHYSTSSSANANEWFPPPRIGRWW